METGHAPSATAAQIREVFRQLQLRRAARGFARFEFAVGPLCQTPQVGVSKKRPTIPKMPLKSFIDVSPDSHFPIQNLPFGIFQPRGGKPRAGVAIGDLVADLSVLEDLGHFRSPEFRGRKVFSEDSLNGFLALGRPAWRKARAVLQRLLSSKTPILRDNARLRSRVFHAQKSVTMKLPG